MALILHYFNEFGKPAFKLIYKTASSSIKLFDQKSTSVTQSGEVSVRINSRIREWSEFYCYVLVIYRLSFALPL